MAADYQYGALRTSMIKRNTPSGPPAVRGKLMAGRIVKILVGQGQGYIRLSDGRDIYFHRADLREGTAFNSLRLGDAVSFELLDDRVSGPRALRVRHKRG